MKLPLLLLALAGAVFPAAPVHAQEVAGRVILATGSVVVVRAGQRIPATLGVPLRAGDTVESGAQSHAQLLMTDDSIISLRPETTFRIREYAFEGKDPAEQRSFFDLVKGGMRTVTGLIRSRENYRVSTQTVSIGIRGTHYWLVSCNQDCRTADGSLGEDGDYGLVREGSVAITTTGTKTGSVFGTDQIMHVAAEPAVERIFSSDQVFRVARSTGQVQQLIGPPPFLFAPIGGIGATKPPVTPPAPRQDTATTVASTGQRGDPAGDTRVTSTVTNNTNFTFLNVKQQSATVSPSTDPVLQATSSFSVQGPAAVLEPTNTGTVFYRLAGPFNIPTTCSTPPCSPAVAGDLTLAVNFALGRATAQGNIRLENGETFNVSTPVSSNGVPITVNGSQVTFNGVFNLSSFPNNRGSFDCSRCGPAISGFPSGTPGQVNQVNLSGTINGAQANVTFGLADAEGSGSFTTPLSQQSPTSGSAGAMAAPRLAVVNPNPNSTVGTDTFGQAFFNITTDASGRLTQVGPSVGRNNASVGGATNTIVGSEPTAGNLVWGTWTNGNTAATKATIVDDNYNTFQPANNSVQVWITGAATNTLPPSLGVLTYTPVGAVFTSANQMLNSASLKADFVNRSLDLAIRATNTSSGNTFQMNATTTFSPTNSRFAGGSANTPGGTLTVTCSGANCSGTPGGSYNGFFSGPQAEGAGVAFTAGFGSGTGVTGVVGLKR